MLIQRPSLESHVIALTLDGQRPDRDIGAMLESFEQHHSDHERASLFLTVNAVDARSLRSTLRQIRYAIRRAAQSNTLHRVAVIADADWVGTLAKWEHRLFRFVEIRSFEPAHLDIAMRWINDAPDSPRTSLRTIERPHDIDAPSVPIVAFELDGKLRREDVGRFEHEVIQHERMRLLLHIKNFGGFSPTVFSRATAEIKLEAFSKTERYAIVNAPPFVEMAVKQLNPVLKVRAQTFSTVRDAWFWITSP